MGSEGETDVAGFRILENRLSDGRFFKFNSFFRIFLPFVDSFEYLINKKVFFILIPKTFLSFSMLIMPARKLSHVFHSRNPIDSIDFYRGTKIWLAFIFACLAFRQIARLLILSVRPFFASFALISECLLCLTECDQ